MTFLGKVLAVLNLIIGLGIFAWSMSVYTQRPTWFDPIGEGAPDKGSDPKTFAQLKIDADVAYRAANAASGTWGTNLKILETLEERRDKRAAEYAKRLVWAHTGKDGKEAFFKPVYEKAATGKETSVMKLYDDTGKQILGDPIVGPDNKPLKGADTLLTNFSGDVKKVQELSTAIVKYRDKYAELTKEIDIEQTRLQKMIVIRDAVQGELFYLSSFEVNVYETRETVIRRQKQLVLRLTELGGVGLKPKPAEKVEK